MKFELPAATLYLPDSTPERAALARITHLGIGAHPDDLELMTWHGIASCYGYSDRWFGGVVVTDGARSPRSGAFADCSDEAMREIRLREQQEAAQRGGYAAMVCLGCSSQEARQRDHAALRRDLVALLDATRPEVVYTHNLLDKHDTHLAVALHVIAALRALPPQKRPATVYGCEVWRSLDWLPARYRIDLDVSGAEALCEALMAAHASQIEGGKRYDLASKGRKRANATYAEPHRVDGATFVEHVMDLTPLIADPGVDARAYVAEMIAQLAREAAERLGGS